MKTIALCATFFVGVFLISAPASAAPVLVDPGFGVDVTPDGGAATVKKWGQGRVDDVIARTQVP